MYNIRTDKRVKFDSLVPCSNCQTSANVHLVNSDTLEIVNVLNNSGQMLFLCDTCRLKAKQAVPAAKES